jgi:hypothetical protein
MGCSKIHEENKHYIAHEESQRNAERANAVEENGDNYDFIPAHSDHSVTNTYASGHEVSRPPYPRSSSRPQCGNSLADFYHD